MTQSTFTATDINHLRMAAVNLAALATDNGFPYLAAELSNLNSIAAERATDLDARELINSIDQLWQTLQAVLLTKLAEQLETVNA